MSTDLAPNPATSPWEMTVGATGGGGEYRLAPPGNQLARISGMFDIGTHRREHKGDVRENRQLILVFQLAKRDEAGNNFVLGERYTWSLNVGKGQKSKFRVLTEALTGREFAEGDRFDPRKLLGMTVLVNVTHTKDGDKTYHNVGGVGPKPDFADDPPASAFAHPDVVWSVMEGVGFPQQHSSWLPFIYGDPIEELAKASHEFKSSRGGPGMPAPPPGHPGSSYPAATHYASDDPADPNGPPF